jgi:hypothetical protein
MRCGKLATVLVLAGLTNGCGASGPTIDASTPQRADASRAAMTASMTDLEKKQFAQDCAVVLGSAPTQTGKETDPSARINPLHGLTADQIHEKAVALRAAAPKKQAGSPPTR